MIYLRENRGNSENAERGVPDCGLHSAKIGMDEEQTQMDYQKLLNLAMDIGDALLEAGAEIYRVEESIQHVLYAYDGVKHVDVFAIPTSITVSITLKDDTCFTRLRRIYARGTDYEKIEELNALSRRISKEKPSVEEIKKSVQTIWRKKGTTPFGLVCAYAGVAFSFTLFFGGTLKDALVALLAGALMRLIMQRMEYLHTNTFFINLVSGLFTAVFAILAVRYQFADQVDKIIIGTLMSLVPGVAITNSIRDVIAGDFMAGMTKGIEAMLIALALALGTGAALVLLGGPVG